MNADDVELALQVDGYVSHRVTGFLVWISVSGEHGWEPEIWLNGRRYEYRYYERWMGKNTGVYARVSLPRSEGNGRSEQG